MLGIGFQLDLYVSVVGQRVKLIDQSPEVKGQVSEFKVSVNVKGIRSEVIGQRLNVKGSEVKGQLSEHSGWGQRSRVRG